MIDCTCTISMIEIENYLFELNPVGYEPENAVQVPNKKLRCFLPGTSCIKSKVCLKYFIALFLIPLLTITDEIKLEILLKFLTRS